MSAAVDEEREVDLARWRRAVARLWWLPVAGLVIGAILGVLYSFRGGTTYKATALISLGQPTSPGGVLVNGFGTNPRAISLIVSSAAAQEQAANRADMRAGALRGHVSVAQVGTVTGAGAARATPLIALTVTGSHPVDDGCRRERSRQDRRRPDHCVVRRREDPHLPDDARATSTSRSRRSTIGSPVITASEKAAKNLDPFQQLVIVSQEDNAETRLGNLIAQQETLQQQLAFAKEVESAKVVVPARSVKASAHSRNTSLLVGALIGLILGAIAAIVADARAARQRARPWKPRRRRIPPHARREVASPSSFPPHDEEGLIAATLQGIPGFVDRIFVVDDASTDATAERARSVDDPRVEVIVHERNRGVGAAIVTGYKRALSGAHGCDRGDGR